MSRDRLLAPRPWGRWRCCDACGGRGYVYGRRCDACGCAGVVEVELAGGES